MLALMRCNHCNVAGDMQGSTGNTENENLAAQEPIHAKPSTYLLQWIETSTPDIHTCAAQQPKRDMSVASLCI